MKTNVARFVTRLQGEGDGLIVGSLLKGGEGLLKPNFVYNLYVCHITNIKTCGRMLYRRARL